MQESFFNTWAFLQQAQKNGEKSVENGENPCGTRIFCAQRKEIECIFSVENLIE
jgi:hypothetical protein